MDDQIVLAHREDGWKPSDPRKLEVWYQSAVEKYGEQLRRISRYLKGWRDHQWQSSRLSSIALMAAVVTAYEEVGSAAADDDRDDLALLMVASRLPAVLSNLIANPVVDGQRLDEAWTQEQRAEFVASAEELSREIGSALAGNDADAAISKLIGLFGERIPDDTSLVAIEHRLETKAASLSAPAILGLAGEERLRRAEAATRDAEARSVPPSKPWARHP